MKEMKKAIILMAQGFEELELTTVVDLLRRAEISITVASIDKQEYQKGSHGLVLISDALLSDCNLNDYDLLILPGGWPGALNLFESKDVQDAILHFHKNNKIIAAICAAPFILGKMGLLNGVKATCYPGFEVDLIGAEIKNKPFVVDRNIITGKGPGYASKFALAIVKKLYGEEKVKELESTTFFEA